MYIVAIFDNKSSAYGRPFFVQHLAQAIRSFSDEINRPQGGEIANHPDDFGLFALGSFDESNGRFDTGHPTLLATGQSLKTPT